MADIIFARVAQGHDGPIVVTPKKWLVPNETFQAYFGLNPSSQVYQFSLVSRNKPIVVLEIVGRKSTAASHA